MTKLEEEIKNAMWQRGESFDDEVKAAADVAKKYIDEALTYGYHACRDEEKGIASHGYGTRFKQKHGIE